eukprot:6202708-Pleurochrysis_carterae.AAC.1
MQPTLRQHSYYGECIASDLYKMPLSSPFGFRCMLCFYDLATKYFKIYYLRNATAAEVQNCFKTFVADNHSYRLSGRAVTWLTDIKQRGLREEPRRIHSRVSHSS